MNRIEEIEMMINAIKSDMENVRFDMAENTRERVALEDEYENLEWDMDVLRDDIRDLERELDDLEEASYE